MRVILLMALLALPHASGASSDVLAAYATQAAAALPPEARSALRSIEGEPRRLLATRAYLRADKSLLARWSWSARRIAEYERSDEHRALSEAIAQVNARFEARNPGYSLFVNTQVRSLDLQLERWNRNPGVERAAMRIHEVVQDEIRNGNYPATPDAKATQRFVAFLRNLPPMIPVPLAAPGLSLHGQSRALDFQIRKDGRTVAGPEVASVVEIWEKQGWARKLADAVDPSNGVFVGPLESLNEPWHYEYVGSRPLPAPTPRPGEG